jgi:hypothetical protein
MQINSGNEEHIRNRAPPWRRGTLCLWCTLVPKVNSAARQHVKTDPTMHNTLVRSAAVSGSSRFPQRDTEVEQEQTRMMSTAGPMLMCPTSAGPK